MGMYYLPHSTVRSASSWLPFYNYMLGLACGESSSRPHILGLSKASYIDEERTDLPLTWQNSLPLLWKIRSSSRNVQCFPFLTPSNWMLAGVVSGNNLYDVNEHWRTPCFWVFGSQYTCACLHPSKITLAMHLHNLAHSSGHLHQKVFIEVRPVSCYKV